MSLVVLQKPAIGEKCNQCGLCCTRELCSLAMDELKPGHKPWPSPEWIGPCPYLEKDGSGPETACGLLKRSPELAEKLTIGRGCFAPDQPYFT